MTNVFIKDVVQKIAIIFCILFGLSSSAKSKDLYIAPELLNENWEFYQSNSDIQNPETITEWAKVTLPHTAHIEANPVVNQWQGFVWYRKKITASMKMNAAKVFVDFEAAMNIAQVFANGKKLAEHHGGYLPFSVDITGELNQPETWLYVKLDNRDNAMTGPKPLAQLDFNTYGGIYRNVWLRRENATYISDSVSANRTASGGVFITYPKVSEAESVIQVKTHLVQNIASQQTLFELIQNLYQGKKLVASAKQTITQFNQGELQVNQQLTVKHADLWSPNHPALYKLVTQLKTDGVLLDQAENRIGIREMKLVNNQLFINGEKTFLRGVNRHQEYPYIGYAVSDAAQYRDAEKIKAAGFDYVRLSHYPQSNAFMQAADELGLVLLDSILGWQYVASSPEFTEQVLQTCRDMIRRDRNHPSVLAWECSLNESDMPESLMNQFVKTVHEEFPGPNVYSAGWKNYAYDIFLQARQHRLEHYEEPKKAYLVSEYGDWEYYAMNAGFNQNQWSNLLQADRSSRQLLSDGEVRLQQQVSNIAEAHNDNFNTPEIADGYWVMFDYNRGYSPDLESSGIMSVNRLPKFSYYFFQSQRDGFFRSRRDRFFQSQRDAREIINHSKNNYMVFIASYWNRQSPLRLPIYTNADQVEIFLNGKSLGFAEADAKLNHLKHPVRYFQMKNFEAGRLEARAYVNKKAVARYAIATPGVFDHLKLRLENSRLAPQANQQDTIFIYADFLDAVGQRVPVNNQSVKFNIKGSAHLSSPLQVPSEAGVAAGLITLGKNLSDIWIQVESESTKTEWISLIDLMKQNSALQKANAIH